MKPEDFGYVVANNICLFQKGPLSQWYGAYKGQNGGFKLIVDLLSVDTDACELIEGLGLNEGQRFNCCEQWMMVCKAKHFGDYRSLEKILATQDPKSQKALGRTVEDFDEAEWDTVKESIVLAGNILKFSQNREEREFLKSFHPFTIFCECAPWDRVWGNGMKIEDPSALDINNWKGQNLLGRAIMEVRKLYH